MTPTRKPPPSQHSIRPHILNMLRTTSPAVTQPVSTWSEQRVDDSHIINIVDTTPAESSRVCKKKDCRKKDKPLKKRGHMTTAQIKKSILTRNNDNQDIKFLKRKSCCVCLNTWMELLLDDKHLVFLKCGHILCKDCAETINNQTYNRECPLCRKKFSSNKKNSNYTRLHLPVDPKLRK